MMLYSPHTQNDALQALLVAGMLKTQGASGALRIKKIRMSVLVEVTELMNGSQNICVSRVIYAPRYFCFTPRRDISVARSAADRLSSCKINFLLICVSEKCEFEVGWSERCVVCVKLDQYFLKEHFRI